MTAHLFNILHDKIVTEPNLGPLEQQSQSTDNPVVVKENAVFIAGYQARRTGSSCLKDPNSDSFQGRVFKDSVREGVTGCVVSSRTIL